MQHIAAATAKNRRNSLDLSRNEVILVEIRDQNYYNLLRFNDLRVFVAQEKDQPS